MLVVNLKNYKTGKSVMDLVKLIEIYCPRAIVAVPTVELSEAAKNTRLQVYAQHVDFHEAGKGTGFVLPEGVVSAGATGTLLNHSEHKVKMSDIKKTIKRCNEMGMKVIVCVSDLKEAAELRKLNPYAIAFEDKKLIATGKSITSYNGEEVRKFAEMFQDSGIMPLCGAGITTGEDAAAALVLGCKGVLVASAVANSQTPEKFLKEASALM